MDTGGSRGAHLPVLGHWGAIPLSLLLINSATPDLRLSSRPRHSYVISKLSYRYRIHFENLTLAISGQERAASRTVWMVTLSTAAEFPGLVWLWAYTLRIIVSYHIWHCQRSKLRYNTTTTSENHYSLTKEQHMFSHSCYRFESYGYDTKRYDNTVVIYW